MIARAAPRFFMLSLLACASPTPRSPTAPSPTAPAGDPGSRGIPEASAGANASGAGAPVAITMSPEEKAVVDEIQRAGDACAPPAKWSACQEALEGLKKARRRHAAVPDAFLLDLLERDRSVAVRIAVSVLFVDLDRDSPLLRDPALAARLVDATERESEPDASHNLASAIGNIDLEATKLDERIRDLAFARRESLVAGNIASRVIRNAQSSPAAAKVVGAWLAGPSSQFRQLVELTVANEANAQTGAAFCGAMLDLAMTDPTNQRVALTAVSQGEGCTKAQRRAAKGALTKRR